MCMDTYGYTCSTCRLKLSPALFPRARTESGPLSPPAGHLRTQRFILWHKSRYQPGYEPHTIKSLFVDDK